MSAPFPAVSIAEAHAILTAPGQRFELDEAVIRGVPTRVWKHAPATLRDVFLGTAVYAGRTCFVHEDERVDYGAFARAARRLASRLATAGLMKGERVALIARNLPEWPVAMFGAILCGAIVTPVNAWGTGPELLHAVKQSGASVLIIDDERLARLAPLLGEAPALRAIHAVRTAASTLAALPLPASLRVGHLEDLIGPPAAWAASSGCSSSCQAITGT
ncbi:MAG: AMP-binding protein, partial [Polyangiales bacterium]